MYAIANQTISSTPKSKPAVRPETDDVLPPAASSSSPASLPDTPSAIKHNQNLSDSKSRRQTAPVVSVDDPGGGQKQQPKVPVSVTVVVSSEEEEEISVFLSAEEEDEEQSSSSFLIEGREDFASSDYNDHATQQQQQQQQDVKGLLEEEMNSQEDDLEIEVEPKHARTPYNSCDDEDDEDEDDEVHSEQDEKQQSKEIIGEQDSVDYGQDDYEDESSSDQEGSDEEGIIDYEEEIELPPPKEEGIIDYEEEIIELPRQQQQQQQEEVDAPHDEIDELDMAPSLPPAAVSASPKSLPAENNAATRKSKSSLPQEKAPLENNENQNDPPPSSSLMASSMDMDSKSKHNIGLRLTQAVDAAVVTKNRSPELVPLTRDYDVFRKRLRALIAACKNYHQQAQKMDQARFQVVKEFTNLARDTPLFEHVEQQVLDNNDAKPINNRVQQQQLDGKESSSLATTPKQAFDIQNKSVTDILEEGRSGASTSSSSMLALEQVASLQSQMNLVEYQRHVIDYAVEWNDVVTSRIDKQLKQVTKLRQQYLHYDKKVHQLRHKINVLEQKGKKSTPPEVVSKLTRNEEKLSVAFASHQNMSGRLVVLMEQAVTFGWKDLYPLVKNTMKWQVNRVAREQETYGQYPITLQAMKSTVNKQKS